MKFLNVDMFTILPKIVSSVCFFHNVFNKERSGIYFVKRLQISCRKQPNDMGKTCYTGEQVIRMLDNPFVLLTTYLLKFEVKFFNELSAFLWKRTACLSLPTLSYFLISWRSFRIQTLIKNKKPPSNTRKPKQSNHSFPHSDILMMFFPLTILTFIIGFHYIAYSLRF